jgi:hypothetical protein
MKNVLILLAILIAIFTSQSCKKESQGLLLEETISSAQKKSAANTDEINVSSAVAKRKDEYACIKDGKSGIKCVFSSGNSCKKTKSCTSVKSLGAEQFFTEAELQDFGNVDYRSNEEFMLHMWEIGWFYHPNDLEQDN